MSSKFFLSRYAAVSYAALVGVFCALGSVIQLSFPQDKNLSQLRAVLYSLAPVFIELFVMLSVVTFSQMSGIFLRVVGYLFFAFFFFYSLAQAISLFVAGQFVSNLAFENITHIGYLSTGKIALFVGHVVLISLLFPLIGELGPQRQQRLTVMPFFLSIFLLCSASVLQVSRDEKTWQYQKQLLRENNITSLSPLFALWQAFEGRAAPVEAVALSDEELASAKWHGFAVDPKRDFPLQKDKVFHGELPFASQASGDVRPNIIVFFIEGTSARLLGPYDSRFQNLTPHISTFATHPSTMLVQNYFNHTAATYRGLHGQLCSIWPRRGGSDWIATPDEGALVRYSCIQQLLKSNGYHSYFLYSERKNDTFLDELMQLIGIETIYSGEDLSQLFLDSAPFVRGEALSDQQFMRAASHFFESRPVTSPFFAALYNFETHAFIPPARDAQRYAGMDNRVLHTLHNFDNAFGRFWEKFQRSKLSQNTIVIVTADHAHFPEPTYVDVVEPTDPSYRRLFFDRIPLLIYNPLLNLPQEYDAQFRSSIDFAPTLLHMLGFANERNSFLGTSLFEEAHHKQAAVGAYFPEVFLATQRGIFTNADLPSYSHFGSRIPKVIDYFYFLETRNRLRK